jgi:hypothetical protein
MFYTTRELVLKPPEHILLSRYVAEATTSSDCIADPSGAFYETCGGLSTYLLHRRALHAWRCIPMSADRGLSAGVSR